MYFRQSLAVAQTAGSAVTAAAATSLLPAAAKQTIPAGYFDRIGKRLVIEAGGKLSTVITTPGTLRFDVRLGGTVVFDGLAVLGDTLVAHTNKPFLLRIAMTCLVVGSAGNFMGVGSLQSESILGVPASMPAANAVASLPWNSAPAAGGNVDLTTALVLDLFFTQTVATGSITLQDYEAYCPNAD